MVHKIRLKKADLAYFRRLALDSEKEIEAYLLGSEPSTNSFKVDEFLYPKEYAIQKTNCAQWSDDDVDEANKRAKQLNKKIIGSIHSHPSYHPIMSPTDYKEHKKVGHRVLGICGTNPKDRKTVPYFWIADSALPCKIVYEGD